MREDNSSARILSVDDIPSNLLAVRAVLEPLGHEIVDASSGEKAVELARAGDFAVVLLDVMMPGMDGLQTLAHLRASPAAKHTPVILITARDQNAGEIERAYALGAVDYVSKPVAGEHLRGKVAALVSLYQANKALRDRDEALAVKDRQIAMLAHDLRNPLNVIATGMYALQRAGLDQPALGIVDRSTRAAERMTGMIEDLLDYARAGTGTMPFVRTVMDMGELCREFVSDFEGADPERHVGLTIVGDVQGEWDRARLYQALSNLVGNATHYGRGHAELTVRADGPDDVFLSVYNSGPPIPEELRRVIFEPFKRGQSGSGLGLGLYIVKVIAAGHQGSIAVESSAAIGTTFTLRLPRRPAPEPHPSHAGITSSGSIDSRMEAESFGRARLQSQS